MYQTKPKKDSPIVEQDENADEILAEIECWLIDDFVDIVPQDRRPHLGIDAA